MQSRIKLIAYWMYLWAALCLVMVYWSPGIFGIVVTVLLAGLFYQAGTGLLKVRDRDRKIAIGLLGFQALGNLDAIVNILIRSSNSDQATLVVMASSLMLIVSGLSAYFLLQRDVANLFKGVDDA